MYSKSNNFLTISNIAIGVIKTRSKEEVDFGGGAYSCITAKKLGWNSTILTRGNDKIGKWVKKLENIGIKVLLQQDKSYTSFYNDYTSGTRVQKLLGKTSKINFDLNVTFDAIHINPLFKEVDMQLIEKAKKTCKLVSLDVQGLVRQEKDSFVFGKFLENRKDWLKNVDILKVGEEEAKFVSEEKDYESICKDLQSLGPKIVALTLGEEGSLILAKEFYHIPAFSTNVIDPTGAGDVYAAAFLIKYFETNNVKEAGLFASATASFVIEDFGSKNIQSREKVEERFKQLKEINYG
jgi:sugar/nucleoside kinase (ribokinase family)